MDYGLEEYLNYIEQGSIPQLQSLIEEWIRYVQTINQEERFEKWQKEIPEEEARRQISPEEMNHSEQDRLRNKSRITWNSYLDLKNKYEEIKQSQSEGIRNIHEGEIKTEYDEKIRLKNVCYQLYQNIEILYDYHNLKKTNASIKVVNDHVEQVLPSFERELPSPQHQEEIISSYRPSPAMRM